MGSQFLLAVARKAIEIGFKFYYLKVVDKCTCSEVLGVCNSFVELLLLKSATMKIPHFFLDMIA